jgi:diaminohydroxyphosphoribosylaminopyrimidine deaminase / 5-amino-6-(5-phosphoribosylamino)uracil reductase
VRLFSDVSSRVADPYFARALALAEQGRGATTPNPLVGCVVVRSGIVIGEGFHHACGQPHAEVLALRDASEHARGADVYVTLEPCSHTGRTPPCTDALIEAGVARVNIGMHDPNPEAAGGAQRLTEAGIEVIFAENPAPFVELNAGWLARVRTGLPLVTVKLGLSVDAHGAFSSGERAAITGPSGAEVTRTLRAAADAVLVSAATVAADDSALTVRSPDGTLADRQPLRVVLVRDTPPPPNARVFTDEAALTLVLAVGDRPGVCDTVPASIDRHERRGSPLADALAALGEKGVGELLIEAGPRLFSALWAEGLIDRLVTVVAGGMAGQGAPPVYVGEPDRAADALLRRFVPVEAGIVGDVSVTVWEPSAPGVV